MSGDEAHRGPGRAPGPEPRDARAPAVEGLLGRELRRMSVLQRRAALDRRRRRRRPAVRPLMA